MSEVTRCFEDFIRGDVWPLGSKIVTRAEIAAYAAEFDPREPYLSGDVAAPWHIGGLFMRQYYDTLLKGSSGRGSPGIETITWPATLRGDEAMSAAAEVLQTRVSNSRPDTGLVQFRFIVRNERGDDVMVGTSWTMFGKREVSHAVA